MERQYDAYLLRWWHSNGGERAEVQHVQTGERTALPSLAAACSWLLTQYGEPTGALAIAGTTDGTTGRDAPVAKDS